MKRNKSTFLVLVAMLSMPIASQADLIASSVDASLSGSALIDFNTEAQGSFLTRSFGGGAVTVTSSTTDNLYIQSTFCAASGFNEYGQGGNCLANRSGGGFSIEFDSLVSAFGWYWGAADQPWTMYVYGTGGALLETIGIAGQSDPYRGFIGSNGSAGSISRVDMVVEGSRYDYILLDNLRYVTASTAVPEPGTLALLGIGLAAMGLARRKKRKA